MRFHRDSASAYFWPSISSPHATPVDAAPRPPLARHPAQDDCSFTDPTLSFTGLSTYKRNVASLQGILDLLVSDSRSILFASELRQVRVVWCRLCVPRGRLRADPGAGGNAAVASGAGLTRRSDASRPHEITVA